MSSVKSCERLLKRGCLTNVFMPKGISVTMLLDGPHGLGKSAICRQAAKDLGGECLTIEGGSLKEGEITGLPIASKDADGNTEVRFVPYITTSKIAKLERAVYNKAKTTGFLNGTVRLDDKGNTIYGKNVIPGKSEFEKVLDGEDNKYKFGEELPADIKLELMKTHEIMPVVLFIDEMNRTDNQTMKEMMNIVLNRSINGYDFPWWVFIVSAINPCGQDSVYSTNEMDAAQRDRFLKIKISASFGEWSEYAIHHNLNDDYIIALSTVADKDFTVSDGKGYNESDSEDMTPSPRSHEICAYIIDSTSAIDSSGFFDNEELKNSEADVRTLVQGKIGVKAGSDVLKSIRNKANYIDPAAILTGKSNKLDPEIADRIRKMATLPQRILSKNVLNYVSRTAIKYALPKAGKKTETDEASTKDRWSMIHSQLSEFVNCLDDATKLLFAKDSINAKIDVDDPDYASERGKSYIRCIVSCFSKQIIDQIVEFSSLTKGNKLDQK
jgi:hypothetical protein